MPLSKAENPIKINLLVTEIMKYKTTFEVSANNAKVFQAIHLYKLQRKPANYFLGGILRLLFKMDFKVITPNTLGMDAIYDWKISLLGIRIFAFQEQVVEWIENEAVSYKGIEGWNFYFETKLAPKNNGTEVYTSIEFTTGSKIVDRLAKPFFELGLKQISRRAINKGL